MSGSVRGAMEQSIVPTRLEDMTVRNLSPATQRSYIHAVK